MCPNINANYAMNKFMQYFILKNTFEGRMEVLKHRTASEVAVVFFLQRLERHVRIVNYHGRLPGEPNGENRAVDFASV
jgi:hypothetical protein